MNEERRPQYGVAQRSRSEEQERQMRLASGLARRIQIDAADLQERYGVSLKLAVETACQQNGVPCHWVPGLWGDKRCRA